MINQLSMSCICKGVFAYLKRILKHVYRAAQVNTLWTLGLKLAIFNPKDKVEYKTVHKNFQGTVRHNLPSLTHITVFKIHTGEVQIHCLTAENN